MTFYIGQKVRCVNAGILAGEPKGCSWHLDEAPVEGEIYTVRRCFVFKGELVLWLDEIARTELSKVIWGDDVGYAACRFRSMTDRGTDISIFKRILERPDMEIVS